MALAIYNKYVPSSGWPTVLAVGPFLYWIVFYYIGVLLSDDKRDYNLFAPLALLLVGIIWMAAYIIINHKGVGIRVSSWIYSAGIILVLFSKKIEQLFVSDTILYRGIVEIGGMSFGIYLIHVYIVLFWQHLVPNSNWLISFVIVTLLSVITVAILRAIMPLKIWRLLGLN